MEQIAPRATATNPLSSARGREEAPACGACYGLELGLPGLPRAAARFAPLCPARLD